MNMGQEIGYLLIHSAFTLYTTLVLVRMLLALARADFYNPLSQFVVRATQPLIKPLRMILPPIGRLDTASLALAFLLKLTELVAIMLLLGKGLSPALALYALFQLLKLLLDIYFFAIIIQAIASWVVPNSYNPALSLIDSLTRPLLNPIRKILGNGSIDFSPMVALFGIYIAQIVLRHLFGG